MPKTNRSSTFYCKLPADLQTASIQDAKLQISLNVTVPKGFEKVTQKIIEEVLDDAEFTFKKRIKKAISEGKV